MNARNEVDMIREFHPSAEARKRAAYYAGRIWSGAFIGSDVLSWLRDRADEIS